MQITCFFTRDVCLTLPDKEQSLSLCAQIALKPSVPKHLGSAGILLGTTYGGGALTSCYAKPTSRTSSAWRSRVLLP